ncbi:hypothetical protein WJX72_006435 [[Myrmecia] bisecta]|uniref:Methyltransferase domain-containing protein n=1 Tax=[Myrmecia] bisecta TaxID=41462 RepID=A0AAW1PEA7_9CHLO
MSFDGLLPKDFEEFRSVDFWNGFFKKRGASAFEWYGDWRQLQPLISPVCTPGSSIVMLGCGNSELSADMYDAGLTDITNVDFSPVVVRAMMAKNLRQRPRMKWLVMDMTATKFADGQFQVAFDKGGLDALMGEDTSGAMAAGTKFLAEVARLLDSNGTYICITLAQPHVLRKLVTSFTSGWRISMRQVPPSADMARSPLQPFFVVVQRAAGAADVPPVEASFKAASSAPNAEQLTDALKVVEAENTARAAATAPFSAAIMDVEKAEADRAVRDCAVFVVPQGREHEWMFSSEEGHRQIAVSCLSRRVIIVSLNRGHSFASMQSVQSALSPLVLRLAPIASSPLDASEPIPFLSTDDGIGSRTVIEEKAAGSKKGGKAKCGSKPPAGSGGSGAGPAEGPMEVDHSQLPCDYHEAIVEGISYLGDSLRARQGQGHAGKVLLVGLGGGGLPVFLHRQLGLQVEVVELDEAVVGLARRHFGFVDSDTLTARVGDGLAAVAQYARSAQLLSEAGPTSSISRPTETSSCMPQQRGPREPLDVIIVDAGSGDASVAMSCPPAPFVQAEFLRHAKQALHPEGMLVMNCVSRTDTPYQEAVETIKGTFSEVYELGVDEDVNRVVFASCCTLGRVQPTLSQQKAAKSAKAGKARGLVKQPEGMRSSVLRHFAGLDITDIKYRLKRL